LLVDVWMDDERRHVGYWLTQFTLLVAACVTIATMDKSLVSTHVFHNMVVDDLVADVLRFFSFVAVSLVLFYSRRYLTLRGLFRGETFVLILFSLLGMQLLITANSFLTLYLGLELMSLCLYALVAMQRDAEAPAKRR
jgi:NADH-quinone oxidoreductase subunit N